MNFHPLTCRACGDYAEIPGGCSCPPAFGGLNKWTAAEIIGDDDAAEGSTVLADLLAMVGRLAKTGDVQAIAWIDAAAKRYAAFHVDDLVHARMSERFSDEGLEP